MSEHREDLPGGGAADPTEDSAARSLSRRSLLRMAAGGALLAAGGSATLAPAANARDRGRAADDGHADPSALAPGVAVDVDCGIDLGPSAVGELLGAFGPASLQAGDPDARTYTIEAWKGAGLRHERGTLALTSNATVRRRRDGGLRIGTSYIDALVGDVAELSSELSVVVWDMPRALSSRPRAQDYSAYGPRSWREWEELVRYLVDHLARTLGLAGARYEVWNEPEYGPWWKGVWRGRRNSPAQRLEDYVRLCYHTQRAITAADPTALVGAPVTSFWNAGPAGPGWAPWGLTEFFERLRGWNEARPEKAFVPDAAVWHDYGWGSELGLTDDLRHGVDHVRGVLEANGFPSDTELWVTEWNEIWDADPACLAVTDGQRAAHLARNVVQQLAPGEARGITRAHWFSSDEDYGCTGTALWTVPGAQAGSCKRLAYHAVQALNEMTTGRYVQALTAEPLVAMATRDGADRVAAIVVNHTNAPATAEVTFSELPFSGPSVRRTVQRIDAAFGGCDGLQPGETAVVPTTPGGPLGLSVDMPAESVRLLSLAPA